MEFTKEDMDMFIKICKKCNVTIKDTEDGKGAILIDGIDANTYLKEHKLFDE